MKAWTAAAVMGVLLTAAAGHAAAQSASTEKVQRQPGLWSTDVTLVNLDLPGAESAEADEIARKIERRGRTQCLTKERAEKEDLVLTLANGVGDQCVWQKNLFQSGRIDAAAICKSDNIEVDLTIAGTMMPQKADILITTRSTGPLGQAFEMQVNAVSTRTGAC